MRKCIFSLFLLVGCVSAGTPLIKSTDGGRTWIDTDPGPPHQGVIDLQVVSNGSRLYAVTLTHTDPPPPYWRGPTRRDYSVLSSSDGGRTWETLEALRVTGATFAALAVSRSEPGTLYVIREGPPSHDGVSFLKTTDGGRTAVEWRDDGKFGFPFIPGSWGEVLFAIDPAVSTNLFVGLLCSDCGDGTATAFFKSVDGGRTWQWPIWTDVNQLLFDTNRPGTLYANGHAANVIKSADGGSHWAPKLRDPAVIALDSIDSSVLLASKNDGSLWRSSDGAETWKRLGYGLPFSRLLIHPANSSLVLGQAAALEGQIFQSQDGGSSWGAMPTGMDGFSFVSDPSNPKTVYGISQNRLQAGLHPPYIRNLAGGSALSPGSLFSVFGEDLAGRVTFNGRAADLLFVSRRQINGLVPAGLQPGAVVVEVLREPAGPLPRSRGGPVRVDRQSIILLPSAPVILHDSSGGPLLFHSDGLRRVTDADPATPGERIAFYATGLGESQSSRYVQFWPSERPGMVYPVLFSEPVADQAGVYRVGIEVPAALQPGSHLLLFWESRNFARLQVR